MQEDKELDITPLLSDVNKEDMNGKVIVLIFWYADCPPCTESFGSLNSFFKQMYNPQDLIIIAVTSNNEQIASAKLKQKPLLHTLLLSNARRISDFYQIKLYPSYIVTDKNHIIRFAVNGESLITVPMLKSTISQVLIQ